MSRSTRRPMILLGAFSGLAMIVAWRRFALPAAPGLDRSWQFGLYMAARDDLRWGHEVSFLWGPLTWTRLAMVDRIGLAAEWCVTAATIAYQVGAGAILCRRRLTSIGAFAASVGLLGVAQIGLAISMDSGFVPQPIDGPVYLWTALAFIGLTEPRMSRWQPLVVITTAVIGAFTLLTKTSEGINILVVGVLGVLLVSRPVRRMAATFVGTAGVVLMVGWLLAGQRLGDLPSWIGSIREVAGGYSALVLPYRGSTASPVAVLCGVLVLAVVATLAASRLRARRDLLVAGLLLAVVCLLSIRYAVVRFDIAHRPVLVPTVCVVVGALAVLWWHSAARAGAAVGIATALSIAAVGVPTGWSAADQVYAGPRSFATHAFDIVGGPDSIAAVGRLRSQYLLPADLVDLAATGSVHIDGWEISIVWAYGWQWSPTPMMQSITMTTPGLDEEAADHLRSDQRPDFVLQQVGIDLTGTRSLDNRLRTAEAPQYTAELLCRYAPAPVTRTRDYLLLQSVDSRCGDDRTPLKSVTVDVGQPIVVPAPTQPGSLISMSVEVHRPWYSGLVGLVLRPPAPPTATLDGHDYALVENNMGTPFVIDTGALDDSFVVLDTTEVRITGVSGRVTVHFYETPLVGGT